MLELYFIGTIFSPVSPVKNSNCMSHTNQSSSSHGCLYRQQEDVMGRSFTSREPLYKCRLNLIAWTSYLMKEITDTVKFAVCI